MKCTCEEFEKKYPNCTECSCGEKIVAKGNGRKYILNNLVGRRICKIEIDGCVNKSQTQRKCDYLIIVCKDEGKSEKKTTDTLECKDEGKSEKKTTDTLEKLYFVELKGRDLIGAVEQLLRTLEDFKPQITGRVFARAVLSKVCVPRAIETDAKVLKLKKILKGYDGNFEYGSVQFEKDRI